MKKEDFYAGRIVYLLVRKGSNKYRDIQRFCKFNNMSLSISNLIIEARVITVGRKYITVEHDIKFDITNNFRQHTKFSADYDLFLTTEDLKNYVYTDKLCDLISKCFSNYNKNTNSFTANQLFKIAKILNIDISDVINNPI